MPPRAGAHDERNKRLSFAAEKAQRKKLYLFLSLTQTLGKKKIEKKKTFLSGLTRRGPRQAVWRQARVQHHPSFLPDPGAAHRMEELGQEQRGTGDGVGAQGEKFFYFFFFFFGNRTS